MKVSILGGTGKFGQHLGELLEEDHDVTITGSSLQKAEKIARKHGWEATTNPEAAEGADVVIFSLPISITVGIINRVGPRVSPDTLLSDVTSVKQKPCEAMKKYSDEVLGMHPMYAPTNTPEGQKVVLCPIKGEKWKVLEKFWREQGAEPHFTDPEKHDEVMSIVQGLMHFSELVVAETIRKTEVSTEDMENFSSPVYKLITDLTARMLNQKSELYGSIQTENSKNEEIRKRFIESAKEIRSLLENNEDFKDKYEELGQEFNLKRAQERTGEVIEFLSEEIE